MSSLKLILLSCIVVLMGILGCTPPIDPPVPSYYEEISRVEVGRIVARQLGVGIPISISSESYYLIPMAQFSSLLFSFNSKRDQNDQNDYERILSFRSYVRERIPRAAVGVALLGPPRYSTYWVVYIDDTYRQPWLVNVYQGSMLKWDFIEPHGAWVAF